MDTVPVVSEMKKRLGELDNTPYNNALLRNTISLTVLKGYVGDPPKSMLHLVSQKLCWTAGFFLGKVLTIRSMDRMNG